MFTKAALLVVVVLLAGCAGAVKKKVKLEVVIPRPCLLDVKLTDKSKCHGPDKQSLYCSSLLVEVKNDCELTQVTK